MPCLMAKIQKSLVCRHRGFSILATPLNLVPSRVDLGTALHVNTRLSPLVPGLFTRFYGNLKRNKQQGNKK